VVAGVEDAAEFVVAVEEGVGFVDEQGGLHFFNDAKEGGGADVGRHDGAIDEFTQDAEQCGFAATFHGGFDAEVRADVAVMKAVCVYDPESERFGGVFGQHNEAGKQFAERIEKSGRGQGSRVRRGRRPVTSCRLKVDPSPSDFDATRS